MTACIVHDHISLSITGSRIFVFGNNMKPKAMGQPLLRIIVSHPQKDIINACVVWIFCKNAVGLPLVFATEIH